MPELIVEVNKTMMIDPSTMDAYTREWRKLARMEIMERRTMARTAATASDGGGGSDGADGGVEAPAIAGDA
jgi:hypothetical protein